MYKEYFKEIFETSKSVIIPGLGSFSKTSPEDTKVTFNPYLKFNDGFLAGFISKKQGITVDDAAKLISDNVDKINSALEQKGEALVLGLGTLKKTGDGKLEFVSDPVAGGDQPSPGINKPEEKPVEKPSDPPAVPEIKPEIKPEQPRPEIKPGTEKPEIKPPVEPQKNNPGQVPGVKVEAPALTNVANPPAKDKKAKKEKPVKTPRPPKAPRAPKPEGQKKKFPVVLVIVLVLLAGAGTFTALQWDMVKGWLGMGTHEEKKELAVKEETQPEENTPGPEQVDTSAIVKEETPEVTENTAPVKQEVVPEKTKVNNTPPAQHYSTSGNFHVIVNCFSIEQNASRMVEKLTTEGHQAHNLGMRGGYYMVDAGSFSSMEEARSKLEAIKGAYPKAWIYAGS